MSWFSCSKLSDTKALQGWVVNWVGFDSFLHLCYSELLCKHLECNFCMYVVVMQLPSAGMPKAFHFLLDDFGKQWLCILPGESTENESEKQSWKWQKTRINAHLERGKIRMFPSHQTIYGGSRWLCDYSFSTTWLHLFPMEIVDWLNTYICFTAHAEYILYVLLMKHAYL